jgi:hypothetical protein
VNCLVLRVYLMCDKILLKTTLVTENTREIWNLVWEEILKVKVTEDICTGDLESRIIL